MLSLIALNCKITSPPLKTAFFRGGLSLFSDISKNNLSMIPKIFLQGSFYVRRLLLQFGNRSLLFCRYDEDFVLSNFHKNRIKSAFLQIWKLPGGEVDVIFLNFYDFFKNLDSYSSKLPQRTQKTPPGSSEVFSIFFQKRKFFTTPISLF